MISSHPNINPQEDDIVEAETVFEAICRLAKAQDETALANKMIEEGYCINVIQGIYNPIMLLAKDGERKAVEFLLTQFITSIDHAVQGAAMGGHIEFVYDLIVHGASLNDAVEGAAWGGHLELVNDLISRGASLDNAVRGAAMGGRIDFVNNLITSGASLNDAVEGAALGGHIEFANALIVRGASLHYAAKGAAMGSYIEFVNDLISRGASAYEALSGAARGGHKELFEGLRGAIWRSAEKAQGLFGRLLIHDDDIDRVIENQENITLYGVALGGHIALVNDLVTSSDGAYSAVTGIRKGRYAEGKQEKILHFISFFNDSNVRVRLLHWIHEEPIIFLDSASKASLKTLLIEAKKINYLMEYNSINFYQAQGYLATKANNWLFQGQQLVSNGTLSIGIYFHILSFLTGYSAKKTEEVFYAANQTLRNGIIKDYCSGFFSLFKSKEKKAAYKQVAQDRYERRITF